LTETAAANVYYKQTCTLRCSLCRPTKIANKKNNPIAVFTENNSSHLSSEFHNSVLFGTNFF